jgi:hypothetical protein
MKPQDPTPAEIEQLTAQIRATWSPAEKMRRLRPDLRPCFTLADGETEEMTADVYNGHHSERAELLERTR